MIKIKLEHSIVTLQGENLFSDGDLLTSDSLTALVSNCRKNTYQKRCILDHGTVKKDIIELISEHSAYQIVFKEQKTMTDLIALMQCVNVHTPVLESLDYFKQHDFYTYRHILMVFSLSTLMARLLISDHLEFVEQAVTGPTHDFGKVCIPLSVLKKATPLTRFERKLVGHHTVAGYVLLSCYYQDVHCLAGRVALNHHERKDGSGYPRGIRKMELIEEIVIVCDVFDALISYRPYRSSSFDTRTAIEEITTMASEGKISWEVVQALVAFNRKNKPLINECDVSLEKRGTPPADNFYGVLAKDDTDSNKT